MKIKNSEVHREFSRVDFSSSMKILNVQLNIALLQSKD